MYRNRKELFGAACIMTMRRDFLCDRPDVRRVSAFGVNMRLVEQQDVPLLCRWRNHQEIRPYMDDTRVVTPQVMTVWLNKQRSSTNSLAYMCFTGQTAAGFTELKKIDWDQGCCEGGIFLFGEEYFGTGLASNIALCREVIMHRLGISVLISRIRKGNLRGIKFCQKYGGELVGEERNFLTYVHDYGRRRAALEYLAKKIGRGAEYARLLGE